MKHIKLFFVFCFCMTALSVSARAEQSFSTWLQDFIIEAREEGISFETIEAAFNNIQPIEKVIELDQKQPEKKWTFAEYKQKVINQDRIDQGRRMIRENEAQLQKAEDKFGVPKQYIVALWGMETSYGNYTGGFDIIPALATLAWEGRRAEFFKKELINALKIVEDGHIDLANMKGSWAGAMGQNQFMPSSFHSYAVDGNGDGRKDIWTSLEDVFASTANYLSKNGWKEDERWGRAVRIPAGFPEEAIGLEVSRTLEDWHMAGVTMPNGLPIPVVKGMKASIVAPDGKSGPAYLVYDNYKTIMRWNRSTYFATSVGLLADAIGSQ